MTESREFYSSEFTFTFTFSSVPVGHVVSVVVDAVTRELFFEGGPDERSGERILLRTPIFLSTDELARLHPAVLLPWNGDTVDIVGVPVPSAQPNNHNVANDWVSNPQGQENAPAPALSTGAHTNTSDAATAVSELLTGATRSAATAPATSRSFAASPGHMPGPQSPINAQSPFNAPFGEAPALQEAAENSIRSADQPDAGPVEISSQNERGTSIQQESGGGLSETSTLARTPGLETTGQSEQSISIEQQPEQLASLGSTRDNETTGATQGPSEVHTEPQVLPVPQAQTQPQSATAELGAISPIQGASSLETQAQATMSPAESSTLTPPSPVSLLSSAPTTTAAAAAGTTELMRVPAADAPTHEVFINRLGLISSYYIYVQCKIKWHRKYKILIRFSL